MKEFFGTDVQDALKKAAAYFNTPIEKLKYWTVEEIVPNRKKSVRTAILVESQEEEKEPGELDHEEREAFQKGGKDWLIAWCQGIFRRLGVSVAVEVVPKESSILVRVIPRNPLPFSKAAMGQLRGSLQHLLARVSFSEEEKANNLLLDIGGDLEQQKKRMEYLAERISKFQKEKKSWIGIHLLDYQDRRLLHLALKKYGLDSKSTGEGKFRLLQVGRYTHGEVKRKKQRKAVGRRGTGKNKVPDANRSSG